jgi:hypothetical protein
MDREPVSEQGIPAQGAQPETLEGDVPPQREASLLNARTLVIASFGLVGLIVAIHLLAGVLLGITSLGTPFGVVADPGGPVEAQVPLQPTIQVNPIQDLQQIRATQRANVEGYGWVDRESGMVRIPVERAMELLLERGLPVQTAMPGSGGGD